MDMTHPQHMLVTGGAGFLGSHLCDALLKEGHFVTCLDNFYTGSHANISQLLDNPQFKLISHDVIHPCDIPVDAIFNLACPASPIHYQRDPIFTLKTSVLGALALLELAKKNNAAIFQASTSEVYGDPQIHPQTEGYWGYVNPIGYRSCYDEGKRCAETLFFDYHRHHHLKIRVGRIFNTYGPRMHPDDGRVVSNFIVQALTGKPITIYGEGQQTRSFCFVSDLIEAILLFMRLPDPATPGPLNLGSTDEFTIQALAQQIISLIGSKSKLVYKPLPHDDPQQRRPDLTQAKRTLGWSPQVPLAKGLKETIQYFDALLSSGKIR